MAFEKKEIIGETIGIIDIGAYKIRVGICNYKNKDLELIGYGEKRQSNNDSYFDNISEIKILSKNILEAIKKAELDANKCINKIIINVPFEEVFFTYSKINHHRKNKDLEINNSELKKIVVELENISIKKGLLNIKNEYGYDKNDLRIIISNIYNISIDNKKFNKLTGNKGENVNISSLNIFIPNIKFEILNHISTSIGKNLIKIIPSEFCLTKVIVKKRNIVLIDLGSCSSSIIVKKDGEIKGIKKISFGINELIKVIADNNKLSKIDIINSINENIFIEEKNKFLEVFIEVLTITLSTILKSEICPYNFYMTGGGSNDFVKNYIKNVNLNKNGLNIIRKPAFVSLDDDLDIDLDENYCKSNLNLYSMIKASSEYIKKDEDEMEKVLKQVIKSFR